MYYVIITPNAEFYTDEAIFNIVSISIENIFDFYNTDKCKNEIL